MPSTKIAGVDVMTIAGATAGAGHLRRLGHEDARVRAGAGAQRRRWPDGFAYTLTRDGAVAEQIRKTIAPHLRRHAPSSDRERTFTLAWRRSLASHAAGIGLRALSIVDLACWDLAAQLADRSIADSAGWPQRGHAGDGHHRLPARRRWVPRRPALRPPSCTQRAGAASRHPSAASAERSAARLRAARAAAPDAWLGMDCGLGLRGRRDAAADFVELHPRCRPGLVRGRLPARRRGQAGRACGERIERAHRPGRRAGRQLLPGGAHPRRGGRCRARRPDLHGRHHRRTAHHRRGAGRRVWPSRPTCSRTCTRRSSRPGASPTCPSSGASPTPGVHPMDDPLPQPRDHRRWPDAAARRSTRVSATSSTPTGFAASPTTIRTGILAGL